MKEKLDIRPSPIVGQWYPADARRLAEQVDRFMDAAPLTELDGEVVGIMVPHAGHAYSGPVAGYAFATLRGLSPEVVAVISPMHYPYYEPVLTTAHSAYATPLGVIPVDQEIIQELDAVVFEELGFRLESVANDPEHSLEIELPFLQRALGAPFRLLPVMVRDQSARVAEGLGRALAKVLSGSKDQRPLLVASTDLSHFYPQEMANSLDARMLRAVEAFDPAEVIRVEEQGKGYACGRGALAAVMWASRDLGAQKAIVLHHATSGDVTGDFDRVVGYGAAVFTRRVEQGNSLQARPEFL
jgi:AmmeMemoRadiSam system protein B